jgi:hypothetical protein
VLVRSLRLRNAVEGSAPQIILASFLLDSNLFASFFIAAPDVLLGKTWHDIQAPERQALLQAKADRNDARICSMKKDMRFTFRIGSDLKRELETIAAREGRSVAQICDAFLRAGSETYRKKGPKYLQHFLSRRREESSE